MKYVVFHLSTGGLSPEEHSIFRLESIIEDTKHKLDYQSIPKYKTLVYNNIYKGDPMALYLNREILKEISEAKKNNSQNLVSIDMLAIHLHTWLSKHIDTFINDDNYMLDFNAYGKSYSNDGVVKNSKRKTLLINVGGKNFGVFQHRFLKMIPGIDDYISFNHRFFDPSILFWDPKVDDTVPNTEECKKRAGIKSESEELQECWDVIKMFRVKLNY